jgi:hypothetical protein
VQQREGQARADPPADAERHHLDLTAPREVCEDLGEWVTFAWYPAVCYIA